MSSINNLYEGFNFRDKEAVKNLAQKLNSFNEFNAICDQINLKIIALNNTASLDARETVISEIEDLISKAKKINVS